MNILLLGHPDIASIYALNRLICKLPSCHYTVCLSPASSKAAVHPALEELATADANLLKTFMSGGFEDRIPMVPIREATELPKPNSDSAIASVRAMEPDLVVSVRYRRILREEFIQFPRHGVINLHSGLLPDYRGVMASFWAMLAGESDLGSTLHRIVDSGIDTGPLISRQVQPRLSGMSYLSNVLSLYRSGTDAILATIDDIRNLRKIAFIPANSGGQYFSEPTANAVDDFLHAGLQLVDGSEETLIRTLISESHKTSGNP
jgi:methionyl-tRNA formyltransferase